MKALVFLYTRVLNQALLGSIKAVRADQQINVPVVMTREAVARVMALLDGTAPLVAKMLYGSGLRLMEAVDRAFGAGREGPMHHRSGPLTPLRQNHLAGVKPRHLQVVTQFHRSCKIRALFSY
jgi:hypothetical protein